VITPEQEPWFVCHTKPRCEKKLAEQLVRESCRYSLPLISTQRRYGNRIRTFTKPLFPGYVFAKVAVGKRSRIFKHDLLVRLLPVVDEESFLIQLAAVETLAASGLEASVHPLIKHGTRVKIVAGPLRGIEGMVEDPSHPRGVVIAMDVLQQGVLVTVAVADIRLLTS
jgi:transcription antitermination factor NusG